jgi:acyl carrier protein
VVNKTKMKESIEFMSNAEIIRSYIVENFLFGDDSGLQDDTSFLDEGIMDSTAALELVDFLEKEFSIKVEDEEFTPENLDSINNVINFLQRKKNS